MNRIPVVFTRMYSCCGCLRPALRRHIADRSLQNLQQRLLHTFPGDIPRQRHVLRLARDLVDLINVNNPPLRALHVIIGVLQKPQHDILHVLADIPRLSQSGGIGNRERHIQQPRQRPGQQRLARPRRPNQQNVALLQLHFARARRRPFFLPPRNRVVQDALVVVVHRDRQRFLGVVLPDAMLVQVFLDLLRLGNLLRRRPLLLGGFRAQLLVQNILAQDDAVITDIHTRAGDELLDFGVGFAAKTAECDVAGACHNFGL